MIKRYDIYDEYGQEFDANCGFESENGYFCKYSDVEKLIELNKEMLDCLIDESRYIIEHLGDDISDNTYILFDKIAIDIKDISSYKEIADRLWGLND